MLRSLLITIAVLIASMPAAAQTTHWSATLTAERHIFPGDETEKPFIGYSRGGRWGEISDDSFEYDGVTYTVIAFYITK